MKVSIEIVGMEKLLKDMENMKGDIGKAVKKGIDRTANEISKDASKKLKADGHIITGRLFASIHPEYKKGENFGYTDKDGKSFDGSLGVPIAKDEAVAGTNVKYAPFIELGTKYITADSFLGFAAIKQSKLIVGRIREELNKIKT